MDVTLEEILKYPLILQAFPSVGSSAFDNFIKENNLEYNIGIEVVSHRLVVEFVKSGIGIGVAVKEYILDDLKNKNLSEIKVDCKLLIRKIGYVVRDDFVPSFAVKSFIDIIKNIN